MTLKQKTYIRFGIAGKLNGRQSQQVLTHYFLLSDTISTAKKKNPKELNQHDVTYQKIAISQGLE